MFSGTAVSTNRHSEGVQRPKNLISLKVARQTGEMFWLSLNMTASLLEVIYKAVFYHHQLSI